MHCKRTIIGLVSASAIAAGVILAPLHVAQTIEAQDPTPADALTSTTPTMTPPETPTETPAPTPTAAPPTDTMSIPVPRELGERYRDLLGALEEINAEIAALQGEQSAIQGEIAQIDEQVRQAALAALLNPGE